MMTGDKDSQGTARPTARPKEQGAPALDSARTKTEAEAALQARQAGQEKEAARKETPNPSGDSPKRQGDQLAEAVRHAAEKGGRKEERS